MFLFFTRVHEEEVNIPVNLHSDDRGRAKVDSCADTENLNAGCLAGSSSR